MSDSAIDKLYSCAARIIKSLDDELSKQEIDADSRRDAVSMLNKLASLLVQVSKLREMNKGAPDELCDEDHLIIEEFLQKYNQGSRG